MSFFVLGVAADFRYAYWCVLAALAGAVATMISRREAAAEPDAGFPRGVQAPAGSAQ